MSEITPPEPRFSMARPPDVTRPGLQILYVAGVPRVGSTILGHLLGNMPGVIFVGELNFFWRRFAHAEVCSCGQQLPGCPFWSAVVREAYGELTPGKVRRLAELERHVLRRQFALTLAPAAWPVPKSSLAGQMLAERALLYQAIGRLTGATWIVDGGKEPVFGALLTRVGAGTVKTVHLVRDPRGVAYSWRKLVRSDSEPGYMPRKVATKTAIDWVLQNLLVQLGLQRLSAAYVRVRYEDLAFRPEQVLRMISRATGLTVPASVGTSPPVTGERHLVAGNPGVRRAAADGLRLRPDEAWRTELPRREQRLVTAVCGGLMSVYGYPLRTAAGDRRDHTSRKPITFLTRSREASRGPAMGRRSRRSE
jgi:hypothetical protein